MRRGLVTKKVCPGFQVWGWCQKKKGIQHGTLTIKAIPNQNQNKSFASPSDHSDPPPF